MEKYPDYVRTTARPLVFVTGVVDNEADIHVKVIRTLDFHQRDVESKDNVQILFRSVPPDYSFPSKKAPKDVPTADGFLKNDWITKHYSSIPSVVVFCTPFGVDWNASEWARREAMAQDRLFKLRTALSPRDIKVIVLMIRIGNGNMEKDVMDERISSFKRHAQTDSKTFIFLTPGEIAQTDGVGVMKKVFKYVKEYSHGYYSHHIKRFKSIEKSISEKNRGVTESILLARFNFKIAFMNEFQNQSSYSLRCYRAVYHALTASVDAIDEGLYDQLVALAEIVHFKLCILLLSMGSVEEALHQFKSYISTFSKLAMKYAWKHFGWVADQYLVFAQLLDQYAVKEDAHPSADRAFYFHNATIFTRRRESSFLQIRSSIVDRMNINSSLSAFGIDDHRSDVGTTFRGMHIVPPRYFGASPQFLDPLIGQFHVNQEDSERLYGEYLQEQEVKCNYHSLICEYLKLATDRLNPTHTRRKGVLLTMLAEEALRDNDLNAALSHHLAAASLLTNEGWIRPALPTLRQVVSLSAQLARPVDCLQALLMIYSHLIATGTSDRKELEELHLDICSLWMSAISVTRDCDIDGDNGTFLSRCSLITDPSCFALTREYLPIAERKEFGSNIGNEVCSPISVGYVVNINYQLPLVQVHAIYNKPVVELGQSLQVEVFVTSTFIDTLVFDVARFHFSDDCVVQTVVRADGNSDSLRFSPGNPIKFSFSLDVTEEVFSKLLSPDNVFCLDFIELIWNSKAVENVAGLILNVAALPPAVQRVRRMPGKPVSSKDAFLFCPHEPNSFVQITKPAELLSIVSPLESVVLLEGILQRVDVVCKVGKYDICQAKVFLSSDKALASSEGSGDDAVFWCPDMQQLRSCTDQSDATSVSFHPFVLNNTLQPASPLLLTRSLAAGSIFVIPLFLRFKRPEKAPVNIKLLVDFVPEGVMKSSTQKELVFQVRPVAPLHMQFASTPIDYYNQYFGDAVDMKADAHKLISVHVKCANALSPTGSLSIDSIAFRKFPTAEGKDSNYDVDVHWEKSLLRSNSQTVRPNEEIVASTLCAFTGDRLASNGSLAGYVEVLWKITQLEPLNFIPPRGPKSQDDSAVLPLTKCGVFKNSTFDWLLYCCSEDDVSAGSDRGAIIADSISVGQKAISKFPLPPVQFDSRPLVVTMEVPANIHLGDEFDIKFKIMNATTSVQKVNMLVMLSEYFLLSGCTSTVVEIGAGRQETMTLRSIALTAGEVPLPRVIFHWEQRGRHPTKIYDAGTNDIDRQYIFVKPKTNGI